MVWNVDWILKVNIAHFIPKISVNFRSFRNYNAQKFRKAKVQSNLFLKSNLLIFNKNQKLSHRRKFE